MTSEKRKRWTISCPNCDGDGWVDGALCPYCESNPDGGDTLTEVVPAHELAAVDLKEEERCDALEERDECRAAFKLLEDAGPVVPLANHEFLQSELDHLREGVEAEVERLRAAARATAHSKDREMIELGRAVGIMADRLTELLQQGGTK